MHFANLKVAGVIVHSPAPGTPQTPFSCYSSLLCEWLVAEEISVVHAANFHARVKPIQQRKRASTGSRGTAEVYYLLRLHCIMTCGTLDVWPPLLHPLVEAPRTKHVGTRENQRRSHKKIAYLAHKLCILPEHTPLLCHQLLGVRHSATA